MQKLLRDDGSPRYISYQPSNELILIKMKQTTDTPFLKAFRIGKKIVPADVVWEQVVKALLKELGYSTRSREARDLKSSFTAFCKRYRLKTKSVEVFDSGSQNSRCRAF